MESKNEKMGLSHSGEIWQGKNKSLWNDYCCEVFRIVMKVASLRCGAVIVLSLFAAKASAQLDSVRVSVNFVGHNHSEMIATEYFSEIPGNQGWYPGPNAEVFVPDTAYFDFGEMNSDTIRDTVVSSSQANPEPRTWIFFTIDSANSKLRQISLCFYQYDSVNTPTTFCSYQATFDSIPFIWNGTQLLAKGSFTSNYDVFASASGPWPNTYAGYIGTFDSIGQEEDSLDIEIEPFTASVSSSQANIVSELLLSWNSSANILYANFPQCSSLLALELFDAVGRKMDAFPITPGTNTLQVPTASFPSGLYFARLGDQVAKFIVPPR